MIIEPLFKQFTEERRYLRNVTSKTLEWHKNAWHAFAPFLTGDLDEKQLRTAFKDAIIAMVKKSATKSKGKLRVASPQSINTYIRSMNAFLNWMSINDHITGKLIKLERLKTHQKTRVILTDEQVVRVINYKPTGTNESRVYVMLMVILDCGLRLDEVRKLKRSDIDFDNFLIKVYMGKGKKQRVVPFSQELRKTLFKWAATLGETAYLFATKSGRLVSARNAQRDLRRLGKNCGVPTLAFHLMRHTMATNYLKRGGSVTDLRRILGHSSLNTTMIYEHLQTEDMVHAQQSLSLLAPRIGVN